jgi:hypothetical protein
LPPIALESLMWNCPVVEDTCEGGKMGGQQLKDKHGLRIGEIRESAGRLVIFDKHGRKCGEYDPKSNLTKDSHGVKVGQGNLLTTLLPVG